MQYHLKIIKQQERQYLRMPFMVPPQALRIDVSASYPRDTRRCSEGFVLSEQSCVIDLAIEGPGGRLIGAAGSDRNHVWVSPLDSSAGFLKGELSPGQWRIIAGAYHIPEEGVEIEYEINIILKQRRLLKGDTHVHTIASDGTSTAEGLVDLAGQLDLQYIFITDHNCVSGARPSPGVTLMPGTEWTHYQGHAAFLGCEKPLPGPYDTADLEQTRRFLQAAREQGAMLSLNHPFCPLVPWLWGFDLPFDAVEVWNGIMSPRNIRAIQWWHGQLCSGKKIPALGGSDYHRPGLLGNVAMPCNCLYALSPAPGDIMEAMRKGDGFISYLPDGPTVDVACQAAGQRFSFGDTAPSESRVTWRFEGLDGGDEIRFITDQGVESVTVPPNARELVLERGYAQAAFVRVESYRVYAQGLPGMMSLLSNPLYFESR